MMRCVSTGHEDALRARAQGLNDPSRREGVGLIVRPHPQSLG